MQKLIPALLTAGCLGVTAMSARSPYISKVYEYSPAPGQFVNEMPAYEPGDDAAGMAAKAQDQIAGDRMPGLITLGAYGGYVIFGFDHPVVNVHGRYDFQVYGNALPAPSYSAEPGVVSVSVDANGNGLPDDPWYELAGSAYGLPSTLHHARVVYTRPDAGHTPLPDPDNKSITDTQYISYRFYSAPDANAEEGWLHKVSFHTQSYWPEWLGDELELSGTRLADNGIDVNGNGKLWSTTPPNWGYADNLANNEYKGFSIDWAVDADGKHIDLKQIDFIKVHTGVLQNLGWIGEESTEISGAEDLHPDAVYSSEWPADPIDPAAEYGMPEGAGINDIPQTLPHVTLIYDIQGNLLRQSADTGMPLDLPAGIYIRIDDGKARKIIVR